MYTYVNIDTHLHIHLLEYINVYEYKTYKRHVYKTSS